MRLPAPEQAELVAEQSNVDGDGRRCCVRIYDARIRLARRGEPDTDSDRPGTQLYFRTRPVNGASMTMGASPFAGLRWRFRPLRRVGTRARMGRGAVVPKQGRV
jgi:hypothetical protein